MKSISVLKKHQRSILSEDLKNHIQLDFTKSPSSLKTLIQAFKSQKHTYKPGQVLPNIELTRKGKQIDPYHLSVFNQICGDQNSEEISLLYPFTIVYPYLLRTLSHKAIPLSVFRSLNTRNQLIMRHPIGINDTLDLRIRLSDYRIVEKGIEIDVTSGIYKNNALAWENVFTYYYRGTYGKADKSSAPPKLDLIKNGHTTGQFRIQAKNGFRFARLTGDTNGIHYNSLYARAFGFKGAFSQPLRAVSKCLQTLLIDGLNRPAQLELLYKGPIYYNRLLTLKSVGSTSGLRFDLYSEDDDRPAICGHYQVN